ncbi:MAG TPA: ATP-binding domain-containing protein [Kineosporiaceae bacterium]|nr:ATP-binding domain-containing protein [Kineosporiaceae bacterium]
MTLSTTELQQEIAAEQGYVDRLYARLDALRDRTTRSLEQVRRAPLVPTPSGRTEREAFDVMHTLRLKQLSAVEERLVFGRLDLSEDERRYVGRIGLSDEEQHTLLLDWRAPAASAFYQATAAEPLGVFRRRHIGLRGRTVTTLDDELLDTEALSDGATVTGDGALMAALTAHRTGRMRDIVATLQAEQDRIVRAPLPGVLVVQGGPGTGKTAVALHRAAYLLYTHRDRIAGSGVLVVGPSPVFLRYIEQVLPSLGETGVVLLTPGQLYPGVEAVDADPPEVAVLKGDLRMAQVVRAAVHGRQRRLAHPLTIDVGGDPLVLHPRVVAEARGRARQGGRPHNDARVTFVRHLLDDLAGQLARARGVADDLGERADLIAELRDSVDVRRELNLLWMPLSATALVTELFARPDRLAHAAEGILSQRDQKLLFRERGTPWTVADVPLLDEAAELIGADVAESAAARRAAAAAATERAEALEYARRVLQTVGVNGPMMTSEVTPEMLVDRLSDGGPLGSVADRALLDRSWAFGHAVVDEAQELSPMQWRMIVRRVPSRSMTVVGDVAQTGSPAGTTSWSAVLEGPAAGRWRVEQLTVNYRTPAAVMEVATGVLHAHGVEVAAPRSARQGDWAPEAVRLPGRSAAEVAAAVLGAVRADEDALSGGRFAVLLPRSVSPALVGAVRAGLAGTELADRVDVLTVQQAKGLEFDGVTVVDPASVLTDSPRGLADLYVALTRPTQRLTVLHHGDLPPGLDRLPAR